eukprot:6481793-Amphidinium_carterae.3
MKAAYYRLDLDSLYEPWEAEALQNNKEKLHVRLSRRKAMLEHFRIVADEGKFYSCKPLHMKDDLPMLLTQSLTSYFDAVGSPAVDPVAPDETVFFKILKTKPAAQKQVAVAPGARPGLKQEHIAVMLHSVRHCEVAADAGNALVAAASTGKSFHDRSAVALLDGLLFDPETYVWQVGRHFFAAKNNPTDNVVAEQLQHVLE